MCGDVKTTFCVRAGHLKVSTLQINIVPTHEPGQGNRIGGLGGDELSAGDRHHEGGVLYPAEKQVPKGGKFINNFGGFWHIWIVRGIPST